MSRAKAAAADVPAAPPPAANPERGEHLLVLAGAEYRLRPTFEAAQAIEKATSRTLLELVNLANRGALPLCDIGVIGAAYIRAGAAEDDKMTRAVSAERIAELAYDTGLGPVTAALTLCLLDAVTGGIDPDASGNGAAAT